MCIFGCYLQAYKGSLSFVCLLYDSSVLYSYTYTCFVLSIISRGVLPCNRWMFPPEYDMDTYWFDLVIFSVLTLYVCILFYLLYLLHTSTASYNQYTLSPILQVIFIHTSDFHILCSMTFCHGFIYPVSNSTCLQVSIIYSLLVHLLWCCVILTFWYIYEGYCLCL